MTYRVLRRRVREAALAGAHHAGLLALLRRRHSRRRAVILLYHRVAPPGAGAPDYSTAGMVVTPAEFDVQMRFLRRTYTVVPLPAIVDVARGAAPLRPGLAAVTFDDGWRDVHEHALPILVRHRIPATLFVATGPVDGGDWFWEERAKYILACLSRLPAHVLAPGPESALGGWHRELAGLPPDRLAARLPAIVGELGRLDEPTRSARLREAEALVVAQDPAAARPFMSWQEARELAAAGVALANHTVSHPDLRRVAPDVVVAEVTGAARRLGEEVPAQAPGTAAHFAYPYGSHDGGVREAVRRAGAASACTARTGFVGPGTDPFQLDRVNICSRSAPTEARFAARLLGLC